MVSLIGFNLGVEAGQVAFVSALLSSVDQAFVAFRNAVGVHLTGVMTSSVLGG